MLGRPTIALLAALGLGLPACSKPGVPAPAVPPTAPAGNPVPAGKPAPARSADQPAGANLFQTERITAIHLQLDGDARASLRRKKRRFARATVTIAGTRMVDVGVRLKGNRSMRDLDDRPSFIVDFDRYAPGRTYRGLRRLLLHAMVEDPTRLRETLGYALYREVGVPAPRTGYVRVRLDDAPAKLYLAVQAIDEAMLAEHFGDATGNLYEGEYGCDVRSADVWGFELDSGADTSRSDLRRFAATVPAGVTAVFADRPGAVDRREVLAYLAMSALIGDFDGYRHHHNYFLYHDPSTRRWSMLPWGIDRVLYEPIDIFDSLGLLARMCLDDATCRLDYVRAMHKAVDVFEAADLPAQASRLAALIGPGDEREELLSFVATRPQAVRKQANCLRSGRELDRDDDGHGCMDCDDSDPTVHPGATEVCDGRDNNCSGSVDDAPACPCPTAVIEGVTFAFCSLEATWARAAELCAGKGMTLASLDSREQSRSVYRHARNIDRTRWWIGLNDRAKEDAFVWHGGAPVDFTYWRRGEPDNDGCTADCVALAKRGKGKWYDSHCGNTRPFVCRAPDPARKQVK